MMDRRWRLILVICSVGIAGCPSPQTKITHEDLWLADLQHPDIAVRDGAVRAMVEGGESSRIRATNLAGHSDPDVAARARSVIEELNRRPGSFTRQIESAILNCRNSHLQFLWLASRIGERTLADRGIGEVIRSLETQGWTPVERLFGARAIYRLRKTAISPADNAEADLRLWLHCDQEERGVPSETRKVWGAEPELVLAVGTGFDDFRKSLRAPAASLLRRSLEDEDLQYSGEGFAKLEEVGISCRISSEMRGPREWRVFPLRLDFVSADGKSGYRAMTTVDSTVDPAAESFLDARGVAPQLKDPAGFSGPSWTKN